MNHSNEPQRHRDTEKTRKEILILISRSCLLCVSVPLWFIADAAPATGQQPVAADIVLQGGKVWTGNKAQPEAEVIAVWGERILAIGSSADIKPLIGPQTRVIDLQQRRVVPGFH